MKYAGIDRVVAVYFLLVLASAIAFPQTPSQSTSGQGSASSTPGASNTGKTAGTDAFQPRQPGSGLIDDTDTAWVWSGMEEYDDDLLHGSSGHAGGGGTYGVYTFHGVGVDVVGMVGPSVMIGGRARKMGKAEIIVDGKTVAVATLSAPDVDYNARLCHIDGLSDSNHVIEIHAQDGWIVVDYIKVAAAAVNTAGGGGFSGSSAIKEGDYAIYPRHALDKCLDVPALVEASLADIYAPATGRGQVWHITPFGNERYRISPAAATSMALTMLNKDYVGGYEVGIWAYNGIASQQWILRPTDQGFFEILSAAASTNCLDASRASTDNGTTVIGFQSKNGLNQQWAFRSVK